MNIPNDCTVYLNGAITPAQEARISVFDRGFLLGDAVYEVVPVYAEKLFCFDAHLARLERSLDALRIPNPHDRTGWMAICRRLIAEVVTATGKRDQLIYLHVSRGVAPRNHVMPVGLEPTVFAMASPHTPPSAEVRNKGVGCITAEDFRWGRGDIKTTSLLGNVLARQMSADRQAYETLMFRDGFLTEGATCNIWVFSKGVLIGPPPSQHVLKGIRFDLLRQICETVGIPYELRPVHRDEVLAADELILSSAGREILPITMLDQRPVGQGQQVGLVGPAFGRLYAGYQLAKTELCS